MTTLSTLIGGPAGSSLPLGRFPAGAKLSLWQRVGGVFRRKAVVKRISPIELVAADELSAVVDDTVARTDGDDVDNLSDSVDRAGDSLDRHSDSLDESPRFGTPGGLPPSPPRRRLLWGRKDKDAAIDEVRNGMGALASLLNGIQSNMEQQGARQEQLLACLSHLPLASAAQTESLGAIREQIGQSAANQARLCAALERLGGLQETAGEALTSISRRIDTMDGRDAAFTASMEKVADAMGTVSRASETGAVVLDRVQVALTAREDKMAAALEKQHTRFSALMLVAISISAAALAVVGGVGYLVLSRLH